MRWESIKEGEKEVVHIIYIFIYTTVYSFHRSIASPIYFHIQP